MRYMTTPKYHRDRRITVAIFTSDGGRSLTVNVIEDRVELYSVGCWSCLSVGPLGEALQKAAAIAAQWSNRDRALAAVLDRREDNSKWWMPAVRKLAEDCVNDRAVSGRTTPRTEDEICADIAAVMDEVKKTARGCPQVFPQLDIRAFQTCLLIEPLWDEIEEFRWVEPDAG